jgi:hypothetical protein
MANDWKVVPGGGEWWIVVMLVVCRVCDGRWWYARIGVRVLANEKSRGDDLVRRLRRSDGSRKGKIK